MKTIALGLISGALLSLTNYALWTWIVRRWFSGEGTGKKRIIAIFAVKIVVNLGTIAGLLWLGVNPVAFLVGVGVVITGLCLGGMRKQ